MMDKRSWCTECQEWVGPGHSHDYRRSSLTLNMKQKAAAFSMGLARILHHGDSPMNVEPEELTEALENEGDLDSDLMQAAYKYIEDNQTNLHKTAARIAHANRDIMEDALLTKESKSNGHHIAFSEFTSLEDFGYDQDEDMEIR